MSTKNVAMRVTLDDLRQFSRDIHLHGDTEAEILLFVRVNYARHNLTVADVAAALGLRDDDTYDWVKDLVFKRRLDWSVITGDRRLCRVRAR